MTESEEGGASPEPAAGRRLGVGGDATGTFIAGDHNVVINAHRSNVTLARATPRPTRRERVALLPRRPLEPLGRGEALTALGRAVEAGGVVQLWGPAGVGKSTLLRHAAHRLPPGADGVVFLTAASREPDDLAQEVFESCYRSEDYAPSRAELRRLMAEVRVTVYLDDAELTTERVAALANALPDATLVLAGEARSLWGEGTAIELAGLDRESALDLVARELRRALTPDERQAAERLWRAALGRPLPLLRATGLARLDPSGEARLPRPGDVAELLPLLFDALDPTATAALHLLASLGDAVVAPTHVGALTGAPDPVALCEGLADLGLVVASDAGFRCVSDVLPALRVRLPVPFPVDRLSEHFAAWAADPGTVPEEVAAHGRALEAVTQLAVWAGRSDLAVAVARAASPAMARGLRFGLWGRLLGRGWSAARTAGDRSAIAFFTHEEAVRTLLIGQRVISGVLMTQAVLLWRELGESPEGAGAAAQAQQPGAEPGVAEHGDGADALGQPEPPGGSLAGDLPPPPDLPPPDLPAPPEGPPPLSDLPTVADVPPPPEAPPAPEPPDFSGAPDASGAPDFSAASDAEVVEHMSQLAGDVVPEPVAELGQSALWNWPPTGPPPDGSAAPATGAPDGGASAFGLPDGGLSSAATTAGGVAGGGLSTGALLVTSVAALTALTLGVVLVQRASDDGPNETTGSSDTSVAGSSSGTDGSTDGGTGGTDGGTGGTGGSGETDDDPITEPTEAPEPEEPTEPPPDPEDLAGIWQDPDGNMVRIVAAGSGAYRWQVLDHCDGLTTVEVSGSGGDFQGTMPVLDVEDDTCGTVLVNADLTIDIAADGETAAINVHVPPSDVYECYNCGDQRWTRLSYA